MRTLSRLVAAGAFAASLGLVPGGLAPWPANARAAEPAPQIREIEIVVDGAYKPDRVTVRKGERVRLKFVRHDYGACTREVVLPALKVKRELPPHKPVVVDLPALEPGEYEFRCGMNMVRGTIVVGPA
jgi:plastocyanin domain-containing protein